MIVRRLQLSNVVAGATVMLFCGGVIASMLSRGRVTPLIVLIGGGLIAGAVLALSPARRCARCRVRARGGVVAVSEQVQQALDAALERHDTDEVARLLEEPAAPPLQLLHYAWCPACRQSVWLKWAKRRPAVSLDGGPAGPVVAALDARRGAAAG